ncbi:hypothetical protein ACFX1Q_021093 [Malus domestica]
MTDAAHLGRSLAETSINIRNRRSCHFRRSNALKRERWPGKKAKSRARKKPATFKHASPRTTSFLKSAGKSLNSCRRAARNALTTQHTVLQSLVF